MCACVGVCVCENGTVNGSSCILSLPLLPLAREDLFTD